MIERYAQRKETIKPMKFEINLASEDYRKIRIIQAGLYISSGILFVTVLIGIQDLLVYKRQLATFEEGINKLNQEKIKLDDELDKEDLGPKEEEAKVIASKVSYINSLISQKSSSWTSLLTDLERAIPRNISISSIQPDFNEGKISLSGIALSLEDLTNLIIKLEDSPIFEGVFLNNQRETERGFVQFSINLEYNQRKNGR